jgi:hypothetical protein
MVLLSDHVTEGDPTLAAMNAEIEHRAALEPKRPYLGASVLGEECERKLWYGFRNATVVNYDSQTLKRFEDGHRTEDLIVRRLQNTPGITLIAVDPENPKKQIGFSTCGGHIKGHWDGVILGLYQAPKTWHIFEAKACADKKLKELENAIEKHGEKEALKHWNIVYYGQACIAMFAEGLDRHYLVACSPGGRDEISVRTDSNDKYAKHLIDRGAKIVKAQEPPQRKWEDPSWFKCKWCDHYGVCHQKKQPHMNCRTCLHSTATDDGRWACAKFNKVLTMEEQLAGCKSHLYLPGLMGSKPVTATEHHVEYADGRRNLAGGVIV